jgi:hypothetical protein
MILNWSRRHHQHIANAKNYTRWQRAYNGGREFINAYLKKYSSREDANEFTCRKEITYCPRFAGAAIDDIKNSIYQRMSDIVREGGPESYGEAMEDGVDGESNSMNYFIGQTVLPQLLVTGKVGIYIDAPAAVGPTLADAVGVRPFLTCYYAEDILCWNDDMTSLLVREYCCPQQDESGLAPTKSVTRYRFYRLVPGGVEIYLVTNPQPVSKEQYPNLKPDFFLEGFTRIPFVVIELNKSFMEDICDYQIALMNLQSSDMAYLLQANFPFYTEQFDQNMENMHARIEADENGETVQNITVGPSNGRRYPRGLDRPDFIHPSTEPLLASMQKQEQMKTEIRHLLNLTLSNAAPKFASAESKNMDQRSLESGLAAIGMVLENAEREIAEIWTMYDGAGSDEPTVNYPRNYSLKSDSERRDEAKADSDLMTKVPSITYQKAIAKRIACTMVGHYTPSDEMDLIEEEIDAAKYISSDPEAITKDLTNGLVSEQTASIARGYDAAEVDQARIDHAARIARIQKAQTPPGQQPGTQGGLNNPAARGVPDLATDPAKQAKEEKAAVSGTVE